MLDQVYGKCFRVYHHGYNNLTTKCLIFGEKIVVFENGLVFCPNRLETERKLYPGLDEYASPLTTVAGYCDSNYSEPYQIATLLIKFMDSTNEYTGQETWQIVTMIKALFHLL